MERMSVLYVLRTCTVTVYSSWTVDIDFMKLVYDNGSLSRAPVQLAGIM
jgi:hypothetical protein